MISESEAKLARMHFCVQKLANFEVDTYSAIHLPKIILQWGGGGSDLYARDFFIQVDLTTKFKFVFFAAMVGDAAATVRSTQMR